MGVSVDDCIRYTIELAKFDMNMLACRIYEIYEKHSRNVKLTSQEKFLIGLRYSEFLATDDTDRGYYVAELKRQSCLRKLGISCEDFNKLIYDVCGLS